MSETSADIESKITKDWGKPGHSSHTKSLKLTDLQQQSPFILNLFTEYCDKDHSKENLDFLEQTRELLNAISLEIQAYPDQQKKILLGAQADFKKLFDTFILDKSTSAITLSSKLYKRLSEENQLYQDNQDPAFTLASFEAAIREVELLVNSDPMQRFIQSTSYKQSQGILKFVGMLKSYLAKNSQHAPKEGGGCCCFKSSLTVSQKIYINLSTLQNGLDKLISYKNSNFGVIIEKISEALTVHTKLVSDEQDEMTILFKRVKAQLGSIATPTLTSRPSPD